MQEGINSIVQFLGSIGPYFLIGIIFFVAIVGTWNEYRDKKSKKNS